VKVNENSIVLILFGNGNRCLSKNAVELARSPVFVNVPEATVRILLIEERDDFGNTNLCSHHLLPQLI
jgi:hypothetical protein